MSEFDPKKYLAEKTGGSEFDPKKYLAEKTGGAGDDFTPHYDTAGDAPADSSGGALSALGHHGLAGLTANFSDELGGLGTAAMQAGANALPKSVADSLDASQASPVDAYKYSRDNERALLEKQAQEHGTASTIGDVGGMLAGAAGLGAAGNTLKGMTALGAAGGLGASTGGIGDMAGDTLKGAAEGAAGYGLGSLAGYAGSKALSAVAPGLSAALDRAAAASGRRAITAGSNTLKTKAMIPDKAVLRYLDEGGIGFGNDIKGITEKMDALRQSSGEATGALRRDLKAAGVRGPEIEPSATQLDARGDTVAHNSLDSEVPDIYHKNAEALRAKLPENDLTHDGRLDLEHAAEIGRTLQKQAKNEYAKTLTGVSAAGDAKMDLASHMTDAVKNSVNEAGDAAGAGSQIKALADQYEPTLARNSDYIMGSNAARVAAAQAANRNAAGLTASLAGAAAIAKRDPSMVAGSFGIQMAKNRGASAAAVTFRGLSKSMGKVAAAAATNPMALGKYGSILARSLDPAQGGGKDKFSTMNFVLSKDPHYQQTVQSLPDHDPSEGE